MSVEPVRVKGHIPWATADARLRAGSSVILSTVTPAGKPHALPVWYLWTGRYVYFATKPASQKGKNLAAQAWVVAHFGTGDDPLFVDGPVTEVTDKVEQEEVDRDYTAKYVDPVSGEHYGVWAVKANALYRIDVRRIVTWSDASMRGWTEWRFD
jgi:pyridoxine/pyridoxamine 5'-phosphate oxidase